MKIGIYFGCFIPLHIGHIKLINQALEENEKVILGICGYKDDRGKDFVPFNDRINLITKEYNDNSRIILSIVDDKKIGLTGKFDEISWKIWADEFFTNANMNPNDTNVYTWYTGEPNYIEELSKVFPNHKFKLIDRQICRVSGTEIRKNPDKHIKEISPRYVEYLKNSNKLKKEVNVMENSNVMENKINTALNLRLPRIINFLTENDMYKYSMGQAILHQFSDYETGWSFKCRNKDVVFTDEMVQEIKNQIKAYCELSYTEEELEYLSTLRWIKKSYISFLRLWHPRYEDFKITREGKCGLSIETEGSWLNTSMYEIPVLAIVNEVYFKMAYNYDELIASFKERLDEKYDAIRNGKYYLEAFSEFGLRRRLSAEAQEMVVAKFKHLNDTMHSPSKFVGTSNVYLAKKYGVTPVGTMAHEFIMCVGQGNIDNNPASSNKYAMKAWREEYGTDNGTYLTDAIGTELFGLDFDEENASVFSGVRHDSGDPIKWGEYILSLYDNLNIDATTKTLLFSDSLNFEKAAMIGQHFKNRCKVAFGIGTYLSNDTFANPLNIVMKVTTCNGHAVAKLSDTPGKGMCKDIEWIEYLLNCINWRRKHAGLKTIDIAPAKFLA